MLAIESRKDPPNAPPRSPRRSVLEGAGPTGERKHELYLNVVYNLARNKYNYRFQQRSLRSQDEQRRHP